ERENYELVDILEPNEEFSAGKFVELARPLCSGEHCVVCSGTGLYVRALFDEYSEMSPSDSELREKLRSLSPEKLLQDYNTEAFDEQTRSNPVRLLRAIEKSHANSTSPRQPWTAKRIKFGLNIGREALLER